MIDDSDTFADGTGAPSGGAIPMTTRTELLAELETYEHLLFEPMTQADLDGLYVLYEMWCDYLGNSPEAIALCDALDDFIAASIEDDGAGTDSVERAYLALVASVQEGGE